MPSIDWLNRKCHFLALNQSISHLHVFVPFPVPMPPLFFHCPLGAALCHCNFGWCSVDCALAPSTDAHPHHVHRHQRHQRCWCRHPMPMPPPAQLGFVVVFLAPNPQKSMERQQLPLVAKWENVSCSAVAGMPKMPLTACRMRILQRWSFPSEFNFC